MDKDDHAYRLACCSFGHEMNLCSSAASSVCNGDPLLPSHGFHPEANSKAGNIIAGSKKTRKRSRKWKSNEEVEKRRMSHIEVERNRRKQMNERLATLLNLIPHSYVPKGDQASIVGGVIKFVKELQSLKGRMEGEIAHLKSPVADVEVKLVGFEAVIKIFSERKPGQLLRTIGLLQNKLKYRILRTQITTIGLMVLYSFICKVNIDQEYTATEIATFLQHNFDMVQSSSINT